MKYKQISVMIAVFLMNGIAPFVKPLNPDLISVLGLAGGIYGLCYMIGAIADGVNNK